MRYFLRLGSAQLPTAPDNIIYVQPADTAVSLAIGAFQVFLFPFIDTVIKRLSSLVRNLGGDRQRLVTPAPTPLLVTSPPTDHWSSHMWSIMSTPTVKVHVHHFEGRILNWGMESVCAIIVQNLDCLSCLVEPHDVALRKTLLLQFVTVHVVAGKNTSSLLYGHQGKLVKKYRSFQEPANTVFSGGVYFVCFIFDLIICDGPI